MEINCQLYRESMELQGLRKKLTRGVLDKKEREEIEKRIEVLEKKLDLAWASRTSSPGTFSKGQEREKTHMATEQ